MINTFNINTKEYWEHRFISDDWKSKGGRIQTREFALSNAKQLKIDNCFTGTILDFGCGLGDAIPVYHSCYPKAKLVGLDFSAYAILECKKRFGEISSFVVGDYRDIPENIDIIIISNVLEHLSNDKEVVTILKKNVINFLS